MDARTSDLKQSGKNTLRYIPHKSPRGYVCSYMYFAVRSYNKIIFLCVYPCNRLETAAHKHPEVSNSHDILISWWEHHRYYRTSASIRPPGSAVGWCRPHLTSQHHHPSLCLLSTGHAQHQTQLSAHLLWDNWVQMVTFFNYGWNRYLFT